jgi:diguanylate cyclase
MRTLATCAIRREESRVTIDQYAGLGYWKAAPPATQDKVRGILQATVQSHRAALVESFYSAFLVHEEGRAFLDHSVVQSRLSSSMQDWLTKLVQLDLHGDLAEFLALQKRVGCIHGRMKVPAQLVQQGASQLKSHMSQLLIDELEQDEGQAAYLVPSIIILDELLDFALCMMNQAHSSDAQERAQMDEAYRHFSLGQDIHLERETQRAALMEWSQTALFSLFTTQVQDVPQKISGSSFGLWMRHRAPVLFQDTGTLRTLQRLMEDIDGSVLPQIMGEADRSKSLLLLKEKVDEIGFLLANLFNTAAMLESGRDPLTRALSRRFLPSVLNREIMLARSQGLPLCVAMLDIDHFKRVNDQFGHSVGDTVLSHVADVLLKSVRANDFVFRYGGEEFLVVFPETDLDEAAAAMDRLRERIAQMPIAIREGAPLCVSLSAGVASFEGHPDYEYLIRNADAMLYEAKNMGRNKVVARA